MAVKDPAPAAAHGHVHKVEVDASKLIPGTTFPATENDPVDKSPHAGIQVQPQSQPGPLVHNKPTTVTLYASRDLEAAGLIPGLHDLINEAFAISHNRSGTMSAGALRLQSHQQLVLELSAPGTFTYVITYTGTNTVIGVASGKRYKSTASRQPVQIEVPKSAFTRTGASEPNTEGFELSSMAVSPSLQRQGVAGLLMELVEEEVKRRFLISRAETGPPDLGLVMLLTTVKEINHQFYARRNYQVDYETFHDPGCLGSENGFTVVHMSKKVEV
jgi:GNAT superfamily N-acetyltransferase